MAATLSPAGPREREALPEPIRVQGLHAYVAVAMPSGRAGVGILFVDAGGRVLRRVRRVVDAATREHAAFRGIIIALWTARRFGSRRIVVHSDTPGVVARVNGEQDVEPDLVGPYLEVRALLHAYRSARVERDQVAWALEAAAVAASAHLGEAQDDVLDLPLWAGQQMLDWSTA